MCKSAVVIRRRKNSARAWHVRRAAASHGGEDVGMNYSSDALQTSLGKVASDTTAFHRRRDKERGTEKE